MLTIRRFSSKISWDTNLCSPLLTSLSSSNLRTPSTIQSLSIPHLLAPSSHSQHASIIAAETGSGKTLAYLLPCLHAAYTNPSRFPSAIIFVPHRELMQQVQQVGEPLAEKLSVKVTMVPPGNVLYNSVSPGVWVTTPAVLKNNSDWLIEKVLPHVKYVVFDEADQLLTGDNFKWMSTLMMRVKKAQLQKLGVKAVFVGATIPSNGKETCGGVIKRYFRNLEWIRTGNLHKSSINVEQSFVKLSAEEESDDRTKFQKATQLLQDSINEGKNILVFVNTSDRAILLFESLMKRQLSKEYRAKCDVSTIHSKLSHPERESLLKRFNNDSKKLCKIMISTNLVSRGVDFKGVDLVVQADFAENVTDYLHRVGRTGRFAKSGKCISFYGPSQELLASRIESGVVNGEDLSSCFSRQRLFMNKIKKERRRQSQASDSNQAPIVAS